MNLLLTGCFNYSDDQIRVLESLGYTIFFQQQESDIISFPVADIHAVVCNGIFLSHAIEDFRSLRFIQLTSAGFDRVPMDKIEGRDIKICNARGVYSVPMAEWAIFRVLEHYKKGWLFHKEQLSAQWTKYRGLREILGKKVAVLGAGNIGQEVAKRFQAFGAETTGFDIHTNPTMGFDSMALTETLKESVEQFDILILTAPLLPSTRGVISREVLLEMKDNAVLVNIARGGLIDEEALSEVLSERKDLFAALDVFETEPLVADSSLWTLDNIAISPHNSFVGDGNNERMFRVIYDNLKSFIDNN